MKYVSCQCIVYWINFPNTYTFTYQKTLLLNTFFSCFLKLSKAFSVSLMIATFCFDMLLELLCSNINDMIFHNWKCWDTFYREVIVSSQNLSNKYFHIDFNLQAILRLAIAETFLTLKSVRMGEGGGWWWGGQERINLIPLLISYNDIILVFLTPPPLNAPRKN